jgi:hypothetical protein
MWQRTWSCRMRRRTGGTWTLVPRLTRIRHHNPQSDEQPEPEPRQSRAACRATGEKHVVRGAMQRSAAASVPAGPMQSRAVATIRGSARTPLTLPYSHVADGRRAARTPNASLV